MVFTLEHLYSVAWFLLSLAIPLIGNNVQHLVKILLNNVKS